jgi:hypothetical protein
MAIKLSVNEVKHIDAMQEAIHELKKPKFKNLGEYGKYIKSLPNPTREQKAIIVYSVLDMIEAQKRDWGAMTNDKLTSILRAISDEVGIHTTDMLKILIQLLSDSAFFVKTGKEFKAVFEGMRH